MVTKDTASVGRLHELAAYITTQSAGDATFGPEKLGWLLFLADFTAYARLGEPITGVSYIKRGDAPEPSGLGLDGEPGQHAPRSTHITQEQRAIVDELVAGRRSLTADAIASSNPPHALGWRATPEGDVIPYSSSLLDASLTPGDQDWGDAVAKRHAR